MSRTSSRASSGSQKAQHAKPRQDGTLSWLVRDAPEYEERKNRPQFVPPTVAIKDVHAAVPRHLFERNTAKGLFYVGRHVALSVLFYVSTARIDELSWRAAGALGWSASGRSFLVWSSWILYWFWQSVSFAGMWTLGMLGADLKGNTFTDMCLEQDMRYGARHGVGIYTHTDAEQCGHDAISPYTWVNVAAGMGLHTFMLTPYFAWRLTHRTHHVRCVCALILLNYNHWNGVVYAERDEPPLAR